MLTDSNEVVFCQQVARASHGKKDVEKALKAIEAEGWIVTPTTAGHRWGKAECGEGCAISIWSTPKNPTTFAKQILRAMSRCPH